MHRRVFDWELEDGGWPEIDGFIYLDVDIGVAQGRVAKRGRCEESSIPSEYQRKLHRKHKEWFARMGNKEREEEEEEEPAAAAFAGKKQAIASEVAQGADKATALRVDDDDDHDHDSSGPSFALAPASAPSSSSSSSSSPPPPQPPSSSAAEAEQKVLRLDASRTNDSPTVDEWLGKIEHFLHDLTAQRQQRQQDQMQQ